MIGLEEFKEIFDCKKKSDFWFLGNNCEIDEKGIRERPPVDKDGNQLVITEEELEALKISGNNIKLDFSCTFPELFEWCKKNNWIEKLMSSGFVSKESTLTLYNSEDREKLYARILKNGPPTTSIRHFIDFILTDAIGGNYDAIQTFYQLIEKNELVIYDKVINGKPIDSKDLINSLKKREQQADDAFGDDNFQFWDVLEKECRYSIHRDNVKKAYKNAGQLKYPWLTWNNKFVWLDYLSDSSNGMEERIKLKQKLSKEPVSSNLVYNPPQKHQIEKSFVQRNWDAIPEVRQLYWKQHDTLTIFELAFILKGKEPQQKNTLSTIRSNYPSAFYTFCSELSSLADSSIEANFLKELNPSTLYCEEYAGIPKFNRGQLIKWAISKEFEVPSWLITSNILNVRTKTKNDSNSLDDKKSEAIDKDPEHFSHTSNESEKLFDLGNEQTNSNETGNENKKDTTNRKSSINKFLFDLWIEKGQPNARGLVYAIKPIVGRVNCPVHKYHGWYDEVCVEWKHNVGSSKRSWGKKTFQNKVLEFKNQHSK
ncbi:MAG: hypothetical protein L3J59_13900 [Methylococcaceae bacterium]|nr:hypothetical protein [Methylococcaceae bacterium]